MTKKFKRFDRVQIKRDDDTAPYLTVQYQGERGAILGEIQGELGDWVYVMKLDIPYAHPVFTNPIATLTIGESFLEPAID